MSENIILHSPDGFTKEDMEEVERRWAGRFTENFASAHYRYSTLPPFVDRFLAPNIERTNCLQISDGVLVGFEPRVNAQAWYDEPPTYMSITEFRKSYINEANIEDARRALRGERVLL